jgi:glycosyltransferase involved in cell wall biosynthesis
MTRTVAVDATLISPGLKRAGRVVYNLLLMLPAVDDSDYVAPAWPEGAAMLHRAAVAKVVETPERGCLSWELRGLGRAAQRAGADLVLTLREVVGSRPPANRAPRRRGARVSPALGIREPTGQARRDGPAPPGDAPELGASRVPGDGSLSCDGRVAVRALWRGRTRYPARHRPSVLRAGRIAGRRALFLHLATGDPSDNSDLKLRAFALLRPIGARLVLVGTPDDERARLGEQASAVGVAEHVDFADWVSDELLEGLYRGTIALVHPSRYERFARLQPLEAMAQGTPMVALNAPGTTGALEGAAELVRTEHPEELADAMRHFATDDVHRARLGERGRERVRELTWKRGAERVVRVFDTGPNAGGER